MANCDSVPESTISSGTVPAQVSRSGMNNQKGHFQRFFYKLFDDTHILTTTFINHPHFRFFKHGAVEGSVAIHSRLGIWCEYQIF